MNALTGIWFTLAPFRLRKLLVHRAFAVNSWDPAVFMGATGQFGEAVFETRENVPVTGASRGVCRGALSSQGPSGRA